MTFYQIYFSPTGGTKKAAGIISGSWRKEDRGQEEVDLMNPEIEARLQKLHFTQEDICLVAVPSFGGRVPGTALGYLERLKGNGAKAILMAVYGNRDFDDTLLELKDTLKSAGFVCAAAVAAVAEHSIIREFATGRPDEADNEELKSFAAEIKDRLENGEIVEVSVSGDRPYREYKGVPLKPKANKDCIRCGRCAKECPVHAIPADHPESVDKNKCISCMHCIAICPKAARHNDKVLLFGAAQKLRKSCSGRKENKLFL